MPWRQKPANWLHYWDHGSPSRTKADGFRTVLVYCVGPACPQTCHDACHHSADLNLDDLPDWTWPQISAHLRCSKCASIGYVDTRLNWGEVINFNKGIG